MFSISMFQGVRTPTMEQQMQITAVVIITAIMWESAVKEMMMTSWLIKCAAYAKIIVSAF